MWFNLTCDWSINNALPPIFGYVVKSDAVSVVIADSISKPRFVNLEAFPQHPPEQYKHARVGIR
jgi:hypothetical protein